MLIIIIYMIVFFLLKVQASKIKVGTIGEVSFVIILLSIAFLLRIFYYIFTKPLPVSDFLFYHNYAEKISKGNYLPLDKTCVIFPHRFGFPLFLGFVYFLFGPFVSTGSLFNIFISTMNIVLVYILAKMIYNPNVARVSAVLYALWPSQIMYSSTIASERLFMTLFLTAIILFMKCIEEDSKRSVLLAIICGICVALAQFIRPIAQMLLIVFLIAGIVLSHKRALKGFVKKFVFVFVFFLITMEVLGITTKDLTGITLRSSMGYNLMVGTNYYSHGMYNNEDALILSKYNYDFDKVHKESAKTAIERIRSHPLRFLNLVEEKTRIMWGDELYAISWSFEQSSNTRLLKIPFMKNMLIVVLQIYYLAILFFVFCGLSISRENKKSIVPAMVFSIHVIAYAFLEVQSRYHYPAIVCLIPIAAFGLRNLKILTSPRYLVK